MLTSSSVLLQRPSSPSEVHSEDEFVDVQEFPSETDTEYEFHHKKVYGLLEEESDIAPTNYSDKLVLFRFSDCILPVKLKQVIMCDLRLLTLLEAGLPSWVIFFQSYPLFCHFYRPWMRHLARTLYILISLVMVIIGFYDLYKNVPLLKATVARLSGPLFGWIEGWDMATRIHYLGTMLFLQNLEKGLKYFMVMSRTMRTLVLTIIGPLYEPLSEVTEFFSPLWLACVEAGDLLFSTVWFMFSSIYSVLLDIIEIVLWPFELFCWCVWTVVMSVYPVICAILDVVLAPIRYAFTVADYMKFFLYNAFEMLKDVWEVAGSIFQVSVLSETKRSAHDISMWQGLWKDLFSKVFQATRSVINGMSAFFMACNRHRLSTYNQVRASLQRIAFLTRITPRQCRCQRTPQSEQQHEDDIMECDRCK